MTSKLTIEQAKRLRNDFECWQQDYDPKDDKEQYDMFGRGMVAMDMLIAGMYQEPVAYTDERNLGYIDRRRETAYLWGKQNSEASDVALYRHAQPAPVVQCQFPCGWDNLNKLAIQDAALVARGLVEGEITTEAHRQAAISNNERLLKVISACRAAMLAAAPHDTPALNSLQSVDSVAGKWIPVSEQMPPSRHEVLVGCWWGEKPRWCCKWATYIPCHPDAQSSGWLIPGASWTPTHWMELPAAPQEPKP
ncbi:DUF551 domain-containing protein [Klebsiella pneumoniae]